MKHLWFAFAVASMVGPGSSGTAATQDWPQWRGEGRAARVDGFQAPEAWPQELAKAWSVPVGDGVSTPSLVGDELFVFAWKDGQEILYCLDAPTGDELWRVEYEEEGADGPARSFAGPRACPTVAEGMVVTLGVRGKITCVDVELGEVVWQKDYPAVPRFYTSSSPIVAEGTVYAQVGGEDQGAVVALDLATGDERWTWEGSTSYSSPILATTDGVTTVVAETARSVVGLDAADGSLLWETPYVVRGRGYNAATPLQDGERIILAGSGRGTRALALAKELGKVVANEEWANEDQSVMYNTPVLKDGRLYGISDRDQMFCIDSTSGATLWTRPVSGEAAEEPPEEGGGERGGRFGGRRGGRGRGGGGYGSVVDAGEVLLALTPAASLVVFAPGEEYQELARYQVAEGGTYAYPIVTARGIYVKDRDSVTLWTVGAADAEGAPR